MKIEFWTSTEYSGFMESLMEALREQGSPAEQRYLISEASYRAAKSKPARLWLRIRQYLLYPAYLKWNLLFGRSRKADVLVVSTNTFYAPLIATFLHKRVIHLVYDLFPEALLSAECGVRSTECPNHRIIRKIVSLTLKRAEANVFLGEHLRDYVLSQYSEVKKSVVIPVGAAVFDGGRGQRSEGRSQRVASTAQPQSPRTQGAISTAEGVISAPKAPTLLYCGNLGRMHDIDTLIALWRGGIPAAQASSAECAVRNAEPEQSPVLRPLTSDLSSSISSEPASDYVISATPPRFLFHCSGPRKPELKSAVAALPESVRARIHITGPLSGADWERVMCSSQIALVTMTPGAENVVMPSKTYSAMMAGQAILAICPDPSDLADTVRTADCGWVVSPGDVPALSAALKEIQSHPDLLAQKRANARAAAMEQYAMPILAKQWADLIRS